MILVENDGSKVYIFSRDEDGRPTVEVDVNFRPYFYYKDYRGTHKSIFGDQLMKVVCNEPGEVHLMREKYDHFEADITYANRYIIDKFETIPKVKIRKCYLDIETSSKDGWPDIATANKEILSIAVNDNFLNKKIVFALLPPGINKEDRKGEEKSYYFFKEEKALLTKVLEFIVDTNPDMIIAYNGDNFDFPYIINRYKRLGLPVHRLSRMGYASSFKDGDDYRNIIKGRILFDMMWALKKMIPEGRESFSLEYISQYELKEGKEKYDGTLQDLYEKDFDKFVEYNMRDVELLIMLDAKLNVVNHFDEVRRYAHCQFLDVFESTKTHDALLLYKARKRGVVLPSKHHAKEEERPEGAYVHDAPKGLFKNVPVGDAQSLYPSTMITFNLSPETYSPCSIPGCINIDNKFFFKKDFVGIVPEILKEALEKRKEIRAEQKKVVKDSMEWKALDTSQKSFKIVANSLFGALAYPGFRLYKLEVADCILYTARKIIKHSMAHLESQGVKVIYSDTDSVFFLGEDRSIEECGKLIEGVTQSYDGFIKQFNADKHILKMQFEKVFKTLMFVGVKKRYAGIMCWDGEKEVDVIKITGFENRRSDSPQVIRDFQKKLFEMVLREKPKKEVMEFVAEFKSKFYILKEELGVPKGISQKPEGYKNIPIHIRAANTSNERHGTRFAYGDKIKFVYIKKQPEGFNNFENVIAFQNKLPPGYLIDYDKMWKSLVENKVEIVKTSLGWQDHSASVFDFI